MPISPLEVRYASRALLYEYYPANHCIFGMINAHAEDSFPLILRCSQQQMMQCRRADDDMMPRGGKGMIRLMRRSSDAQTFQHRLRRPSAFHLAASLRRRE